LLANTECQSLDVCLTHRLREQARSHRVGVGITRCRCPDRAEVLLLDLGIRTVSLHGSDALVDQRPQFLIVLAQAHGDVQRQGWVLEGRAGLEVGAFGLGQEIELGFELVGQGRVKTAVLQVGVVLVLGLVRLDLRAELGQVRTGIGLLQRTLQHADLLALEGFGGVAEVGALAGNHRGRAQEQAVGEVDDFFAGRGHGHGRHDGVELARAQGRDHPVEFVVHPSAFDFELGADGVAQFDIKSLQAAIGGDGLKGWVFGEYAEADFFPFLGVDGGGAQWQQQRSEE